MADPVAKLIPTPLPQPRRYWLLALLVIALGAGNLFLNPLGFSGASTYEWLVPIFIASMLAQPVLLAQWAVLGPGSSAWRIPLTIVVAATLFGCTYFAQFSLFQGSRSPSFEDIRIYFYMWSGTLVVGVVASLIIRCVTRWRIFHLQDASPSAATPNQFSMRYLLILTSLCAVVLGIARTLASHHWSGFSDVRPGEFISILIGLGLIMLAIFPTFAIPWVALSPRPTLQMLIGVPLAWATLSWLSVETVMAVAANEPRLRIARDVGLLQGGAAAVGLISALAVRFAGYRLFSRNSLRPQPLAPSPETLDAAL